MIPESKYWFVLQTEPKCEQKAEKILNQKGYECLLPLSKQRRSWCYKTIEVNAPLFPMYVFCRDTISSIGKTIVTPGVRRVLGVGGRPSVVAEEEILAVKRLSESALLREPWEYVPDGVTIQVETGPLAGTRGIYKWTEDKHKLIISVIILQCSVAIQLSNDTVITVVDEEDKAVTKSNMESYFAIKLLRRVKDVSM